MQQDCNCQDLTTTFARRNGDDSSTSSVDILGTYFGRALPSACRDVKSPLQELAIKHDSVNSFQEFLEYMLAMSKSSAFLTVSFIFRGQSAMFFPQALSVISG